MGNFDLLLHVQIILYYTAVKFNYLQRQSTGFTKTSKRVVYYKMITSAVQKGYVQFFVPLVQEHLLQACITAANRSTPIFTPGTTAAKQEYNCTREHAIYDAQPLPNSFIVGFAQNF